MEDTYHVLTVLRVPECARTPLTVAIATDTGGVPMLVSKDAVYTEQFDLLPVMDMSFRQDGVDYVDRVYVATDAPFVGTAYTYRCNGYYGAVGYMPKCQNLAPLEMRDPAVRDTGDNAAYIVGGIPGLTNFNDYWGDSGGVPDGGSGTVSLPGDRFVIAWWASCCPLHKRNTGEMNTAMQYVARYSDTVALMNALERDGIDVTQDWENEETRYDFDDNSWITVSGAGVDFKDGQLGRTPCRENRCVEFAKQQSEIEWLHGLLQSWVNYWEWQKEHGSECEDPNLMEATINATRKI